MSAIPDETSADDELRQFDRLAGDIEDYFGALDTWGAKARRRAQEVARAMPRHKPSPYFRLGSDGARDDRVGVSKAAAAFWLPLCRRLTNVGAASDFDTDTRRGYTIACGLTGLRWSEVQKALGDCSRAEPEVVAAAWHHQMAPPSPKLVGNLYVATCPALPGQVKVGFSVNPPGRRRSLERELGASVTMDVISRATMLHEWALHQTLLHRTRPEWYPIASLPAWLLPNSEHA